MSSQQDYASNISVAEAIAIVQEHAPRLEPQEVPLLNALGRTLARDLKSKVDHPSCHNSALDGYACREADSLAASAERPVSLRVVGEVPAGGNVEAKVGEGEAVSIYTGAPVPAGADAIIAVEDTERDGERVLLKRPARPADIRPRAQDLQAGEVYLKSGSLLNPAALGVAAAMGYATIPVTRKPRIGLLATGDEVIEPGEPIRDGQVYNSNSYALAGMIDQAGGEAIMLPRSLDDVDALKKALEQRGDIDLLLTSGGVSMGKYDLVRDLLFDEGNVYFWKVAIRPGGPALFGEWRGLMVFGLPGNPVSSMVVFKLLTQAWLHKALGSSTSLPYETRLMATAQDDFKGAGFKESFQRGVLSFDQGRGDYTVSSTGNQGSGILTSMLHANALVIVPPHQNIQPGESCEVIPM